MRIVTLLARHGTRKYAQAAQGIKSWFSRQLPEVQHDLVISDTALAEDHVQRLGEKEHLIGSSNAHWEFSAWDRAIAYLGSRIDEYDVLHLATSAYGALDNRYLDYFNTDMLRLLLRRRVAVGTIDFRPEPVVVCGTSSQAWLRSSWIFVPPSEVCQLGSLVSLTEWSGWFSGDPAAPFRDEAPISDNYRRFILAYLAGAGDDWEWHSQFVLNIQTLPHFEYKTRAILNEHLLSIRLQAQGCSMLDAMWLASRRTQWPELGLDHIPSWQYQTSARELMLRYQTLNTATRATLIAGESGDIAERHGPKAARTVLRQAMARDPALAITRPVLGALRRAAW